MQLNAEIINLQLLLGVACCVEFPVRDLISKRSDKSTDYFYMTDHLGSIREMTDGGGAIQARYDYDPYGRQTKLSSPTSATPGTTNSRQPMRSPRI